MPVTAEGRGGFSLALEPLDIRPDFPPIALNHFVCRSTTCQDCGCFTERSYFLRDHAEGLRRRSLAQRYLRHPCPDDTLSLKPKHCYFDVQAKLRIGQHVLALVGTAEDQLRQL